MVWRDVSHIYSFSYQHHSTRHAPGQPEVPRAHTRKLLNNLAPAQCPCPTPHQEIHGTDLPHPSQTRAEGPKEQCHNLDLKSGPSSHLLRRTDVSSEVQKWGLKAKDPNITNIYLWLSLQTGWHKTYDLYQIQTVPLLWNLLFCWYFTSKALLWRRINPPSEAAQKSLQKPQSTGDPHHAGIDWLTLPSRVGMPWWLRQSGMFVLGPDLFIPGPQML